MRHLLAPLLSMIVSASASASASTCKTFCAQTKHEVCVWATRRTYDNPCLARCDNQLNYHEGTCAALRERQREYGRAYSPGTTLFGLSQVQPIRAGGRRNSGSPPPPTKSQTDAQLQERLKHCQKKLQTSGKLEGRRDNSGTAPVAREELIRKVDECEKKEKEEEEAGANYFKVIDYLLFMLLIGILLAQVVATWVPFVPYSVVLLLFSMMMGAMHQKTDYALGILSVSMQQWIEIPPHLVLYALLPPLLFGDSMLLKWHLVYRCFVQCFLLACPGVVFGTVMTAIVVYYLPGWGWDWKLSLCFGSILAATDPVAVVSVLKELGASPKLTMIVSGESLMNDGTAIVLFTLFLNMCLGTFYDFGSVTAYFFQVAVGGPGVGIAFGLAGTIFLRLIAAREDHLSQICQITLTVCLAYGSFFWGEYSAGVSGVLSCVSAAIVISALGWPYITNRKVVETVWHALDFVFNTIVFMLAGLIVGATAAGRAGGESVDASDWGWIVVIYIFCQLIRAAMVFLLYPALRYFGYGMDIPEAIVLTWGGLRGAVGLVLALIVDEEATRGKMGPGGTYGKNFTFLVGGVATLTLLINGTTCGILVNKLGLVTPLLSKQVITAYVKDKFFKQASAEYEKLCNDPTFQNHDHAMVQHWCPVLREEFNAGMSSTEAWENSMSPTSDRETHPQLLKTTREVFLNTVQEQYWRLKDDGEFPGGILSSSATTILLHAVDKAFDDVEEGLNDWKYVKDRLRWGEMFESLPSCIRMVVDSGHDGIELNVYCVLSFIKAHKNAQQLACYYFGKDETADTPEEKQVVAESEALIAEAQLYLRSCHEGIIRIIRTKQVAKKILTVHKKGVEHTRKRGLITHEEAEEMLLDIANQVNTLVYSRHDNRVLHNSLNEQDGSMELNQNPVQDLEAVIQADLPEIQQHDKSSLEGKEDLESKNGSLENKADPGPLESTGPVVNI